MEAAQALRGLFPDGQVPWGTAAEGVPPPPGAPYTGLESTVGRT